MTLRDLVALSIAPGSTRRKAQALAALAVVADAPPDEALLDALLEWSLAEGGGAPADPSVLRLAADEALVAAAACGVQVIAWRDPRYPAALAAIADPPLILWSLGSTDALDGRLVAIVGSRAASPYGLAVAERLGHDLGRAGVTVVSGMARGCDAAAHAGALSAGGHTVAVLGSGVDVPYPAEHRDLHRRIQEQGLILSEWPPGTPPLAHHFPLRNRIISGLARAVIVIEASDRSGSLITAACALEQGRDVMAVPGPIVGDRHRGSHALLRDGARLVGSAEDVLEELGWLGRQDADVTDGADEGFLQHLAPGEDCDLESLAARTGLDVTTLLSRLMELELAGKVRRVAGGRFLRSSWQ